ncbi:hypothetical protein [Shimia sp.]|uniref:hypothetical protein n=1 Tax=Shimia sp. TaxID=1954381 RepID=UPI00329A6E2F
MKMRFLAFTALAALQVSGAIALESEVVRQVQQCMKKTHAPGSYAITQFEPVPTVSAHSGGSELGTHNVNDCLKDTYQVQYRSDAAVCWGAGASSGDAQQSGCLAQDQSGKYGFASTEVDSNICSRRGGPLYGGTGYC